MKTLLLGAGGQLGRALVREAPARVEMIAADRQGLDITNPEALRRCVERAGPAVVINAAAYTAVDQAEVEPAQAHAVNSEAVAALAAVCRDHGARLIHVSTDFVFDGTQSRPYLPEDPVGPLNVYGESKLAGERAIAATKDLRWLIVRTAWVYSSTGRNFVRTMVSLFRERPKVSVVSDQVGTPTSAASLARCLWKAVADEGDSEILHFTDAGVASWYDLAVAAYEEARAIGSLSREVDIVPIPSAAYVTRARRPSFSVLDKERTLSRLGIVPVHWRSELRGVIRELAG